MEETKLEHTYKRLDFGNHFKEFKESLAEFRATIEELNILQKDP